LLIGAATITNRRKYLMNIAQRVVVCKNILVEKIENKYRFPVLMHSPVGNTPWFLRIDETRSRTWTWDTCMALVTCMTL
jgi:hypothetical protein